MRILCVGEMLVDVIVRPVEQVLLQNDTQQVQEIRMASGGDANNNAIDLARLGHQVTYLGRLGRDEMGDFVAQTARAEGVNMDHTVRSTTADQAKSLILINSQGNRTFLQDPGTSAEFCFEDCDLTQLAHADLLQIAGTFHLPHFDGEGAAKLLRAAKEHGIITSMDVTSDRSGQWTKLLEPCYPYLDHFLPSIEQAIPISERNDPREIADYFLEKGVRNVAIKLGSRGSYFKNSETAFYAGTFQNLNIVETTGAGDAFCAGYITGIGEGYTPKECVTLATACSSFVIQTVGATAGMEHLEDIRAFIRSRPPLLFQEDG